MGTLATTPTFANPYVDIRHVTDGAGLNDLDDASIVVARVDLRAELRGDTTCFGRLGNDP